MSDCYILSGRCKAFISRTKLNFPHAGGIVGTPTASALSPRDYLGNPNCRTVLQDGGGLKRAWSINEQACNLNIVNKI